MQRRHITTAAVTAAASLVLPTTARAQSMHHEKNVIFTAEDPGHWAGVEALHVPETTVADGVLTVRTPHPMTAPHFIVCHTVVLSGGKFLDRKTFVYTDQPISTYTLPAGYTGKVIVTSTCNLHDFWVKTISV